MHLMASVVAGMMFSVEAQKEDLRTLNHLDLLMPSESSDGKTLGTR